MSAIDRVVDLTITRAIAVVSKKDFGTLLVAAEFEKSDATPAFGDTERVRSYASLDEISNEFGTSSDIYYAAVKAFGQNPSPEEIKIGRKVSGTDGTETWTEALTAIKQDTNEWYGLACLTRTLDDQELIADWVEANEKLCGFSTADINCLDDSSTDDIMYYLSNNSYKRNFAIYNSKSTALGSTDEYPAVAWMAYCLSNPAGSQTWALKTLAGVTPETSLTDSQLNAMDDKNGNYYLKIAGNNVTLNGKVGLNAAYIDEIRGEDWLKYEIQSKIFLLLSTNLKVSFTDGGIDSVITTLKEALGNGIDQGILSEYTVEYPTENEVDSNDKANRLLPDVLWDGTLAGAIHKVKINGRLTV